MSMDDFICDANNYSTLCELYEQKTWSYDYENTASFAEFMLSSADVVMDEIYSLNKRL